MAGSGLKVGTISVVEPDWPTMRHADTLSPWVSATKAKSSWPTARRIVWRTGAKTARARGLRWPMWPRAATRREDQAHDAAGIRRSIESNASTGLDSLLSIVQMPGGTPVELLTGIPAINAH